MNRFRQTLSGTLIVIAMFSGFLCSLVLWRSWTRHDFAGELRIVLGEQQANAIRPSEPVTDYPFPLWPDVRGDQLSFEDDGIKVNWINPRASYDVVRMPFSVRWTQSNVQSPAQRIDYLEIGNAPDSPIQVREGTVVDIDDGQFVIEAIRPWSGLLRTAEGSPMAALRVAETGGTWGEVQFLAADRNRLRIDQFLDAHFIWGEDMETEMEPVAVETSYRWRVFDGDTVHEFNNINPGTGVTLNDGRSVVLLDHDLDHAFSFGNHPAIQVMVETPEGQAAHWIPANRPVEGIPVSFAWSGTETCVLTLRGAMDGQAVLAATRGSTSFGPEEIHAGQVWAPAGFPYRIQLAQVMEHALVVSEEASPFLECVLLNTVSGERHAIREGERQRVGQESAAFRTQREEAVYANVLSIIKGDSAMAAATVNTGETFSYGDWRLRPLPMDARTPDLLMLEAVYTAPAAISPAILLAFLAILCILGVRQCRT